MSWRAWKVTYRERESQQRYMAKELLVVTPADDPAPVKNAIKRYADSNFVVIDRVERLEPAALVVSL